jgi:hypothetical protein
MHVEMNVGIYAKFVEINKILEEIILLQQVDIFLEYVKNVMINKEIFYE